MLDTAPGVVLRMAMLCSSGIVGHMALVLSYDYQSRLLPHISDTLDTHFSGQCVMIVRCTAKIGSNLLMA